MEGRKDKWKEGRTEGRKANLNKEGRKGKGRKEGKQGRKDKWKEG